MTDDEIQRPNPIESSVRLSSEGRNFDAFTSWFQAPSELRDEAVLSTVKWIGENHKNITSALHDENKSPQNEFILDNFALLASDTGAKMFAPTHNTKISFEELEEFQYTSKGTKKFVRRIRGVPDAENAPVDNSSLTQTSFGGKIMNQQRLAGVNFDMFTTTSGESTELLNGRDLITTKLDESEAALLFKKMLPHINLRADETYNERYDDIPSMLFDRGRHLNVVIDPEVGKYFERWAIPDESEYFEDGIASSILYHSFPSAEYFEKVFASGKNYTDADSTFDLKKDDWLDTPEGTIPASFLYFTLLRQITHLDDYVNSNLSSNPITPEQANMMKDRIVGYLFSDAFMQRALPYLSSQDEYHEDLRIMESPGGVIAQDPTIVKKGSEAQEDKSRKFGEILKATEKFLNSKGDTETTQRLRERKVGDVSFGNYLQGA